MKLADFEKKKKKAEDDVGSSRIRQRMAEAIRRENRAANY